MLIVAPVGTTNKYTTFGSAAPHAGLLPVVLLMISDCNAASVVTAGAADWIMIGGRMVKAPTPYSVVVVFQYDVCVSSCRNASTSVAALSPAYRIGRTFGVTS